MLRRLQRLLFHNHTSKQTLFKNTFWLGLIEFFSKIILFFVTILIVRSFGPTNFGKFNLAFSYAAIIMVLSDFGLNTIVTREVAKYPDLVDKYLGNTLSIKIIISIFLGIISFFIRPLFNSDPFIQKLFLLCIAYNLIQNIFSLFISVFSGLEKMEYIFVSRLVFFLGILFSAILITTNNSTPDKLLLLYIVTSIITLLFIVALIIINKIKISLEFDFVFWKKILIETLPLLGMAILIAIYLNNDTILIGRFFGPEKVGFYQSAYKILFAFQSVNIVNSVLFPRFSALIHQKNYVSLNKLIRLTLLFSFIVLIPLATGITIFAKPIINIIYGSVYSSASLAMILLIWSGVVTYFRTFVSILLIASNRQNSFFYIFLIGTIVNLTMNITLTPHYNFYLPALSLLISETLITLLATILYVQIRK